METPSFREAKNIVPRCSHHVLLLLCAHESADLQGMWLVTSWSVVPARSCGDPFYLIVTGDVVVVGVGRTRRVLRLLT